MQHLAQLARRRRADGGSQLRLRRCRHGLQRAELADEGRKIVRRDTRKFAQPDRENLMRQRQIASFFEAIESFEFLNIASEIRYLRNHFAGPG